MNEPPLPVLLVGGDERTRRLIGELGRERGWVLEHATTLSAGLSSLAGREWSAAIVSLDLEGSGPELLARIAEEPNAGLVVGMMRSPTAESTLAAARAGVGGVFRDPLDHEQAERLIRMLAPAGARVRVTARSEGLGGLFGRSPELLAVLEEAVRIAPSSATVLVTGESGTGKELVARLIHEASGRARGPFVAVNCAAIPEDLLEAELFGHERGAFTGAVARKVGRFERADGGTLFLDEIGDMSLVLQAKILRAVQEREIERLGAEDRIQVDARIIAATHRDLRALVGVGEFREDLYYRLAVITLSLPPLRTRAGDIRELALEFVGGFGREHGRPVRFVSESALSRLEAHGWPGNVRELRNVLERAVLLCRGDTIRAEDVVLEPWQAPAPAGESLPGYRSTMTMAEVEALHLARVLDEVDGHIGRAASILQLHRNTIARKAAEYGLLRR